MLRGLVRRYNDATFLKVSGLTDMPATGAANQSSDVRPVIPDFDRIFREPLVAADLPGKSDDTRSFFARHRNGIWWAMIFLVISVSGAVIFAWPSESIVDPECGGSMWFH
jgi:hypothetical protein